MDKTQYSPALRNAVAYVKGAKKIKVEGEISTRTGFSKGTVSSYLSGNHMPSVNFIEKFEKEFNLKLKDYIGEVPVPINTTGNIELETLIRTESLARVNASYIAEIYGHLKNVPATKVLNEMVQTANSESAKRLDELKAR